MQASVPLEQHAGVRLGHSRPRDNLAQFAVRLNHSAETFAMRTAGTSLQSHSHEANSVT